jgi:PAS domain S-box-containing protein
MMHGKVILVRYAVALLAMALCLLIRWPLKPVLGDNFPYLTFYLGIMVSSFRGGLGPGLFATVLGGTMIVTSPFGLLPRFTLNHVDGIGLLTFVVIGVVTSVLNEDIQRYRSRMLAARARIQEGEALYETTLASLGDAVVVIDLAGRIVFLNAAAQALTGWGNDALGREYTEVLVLREDDVRVAIDSAVVAALRQGTVQRTPDGATLVARNGRPVPIEASAAPVRDRRGEVRRAVLVFRDVTRQKRAEEALREADRRKDGFLVMLGHEMRNPLGPIRNAVQILRLRGDEPATIAYVCDLLERQSLRMGRLVDQLLDAAHVARGQVNLRRQRLDLAGLVHSAAEDHRPLLENGGLALNVDVPSGPVWVAGDLARLTQVLGNLMANAAKYTDAGGRVQVRLVEQGGDAVVTIDDTGIGIEADVLPRLFEAFSQAAPRPERSKGGLGLGLAVVKGLVVLHGGQVGVTSNGPGQGAEFRFSLPLDHAPPPRPPARPEPQTRRRQVILVIEDNPDGAESLCRLLALLGHQAVGATSGPEGLETAGRLLPDVVLCDVGLPGMSGYDVARALRQGPNTKTVRLIAVSGFATAEAQRQAMEAGFDEFHVKPIEPATLKRVVGQAAMTVHG